MHSSLEATKIVQHYNTGKYKFCSANLRHLGNDGGNSSLIRGHRKVCAALYRLRNFSRGSLFSTTLVVPLAAIIDVTYI